jgi:hypothetical protein
MRRRHVAPYSTLLRPVAPCCNMLRPVAPCCNMLRPVAPCCTMLRLLPCNVGRRPSPVGAAVRRTDRRVIQPVRERLRPRGLHSGTARDPIGGSNSERIRCDNNHNHNTRTERPTRSCPARLGTQCVCAVHRVGSPRLHVACRVAGRAVRGRAHVLTGGSRAAWLQHAVLRCSARTCWWK